MKGQLWYKSHEDDQSRKLQDDMDVLTEPPGIQSRSGYHVVLIKDEKDEKSDLITLHQHPDGSQWADCEKWSDGIELSELLDMKSRSDSRPVLKTDLPKPLAQEAPAKHLIFPSTLQEFCNLGNRLNTFRLEKAVGQLLVSGYATSGKCLSLLTDLKQLVQAYDNIHHSLRRIPDDMLHQADEAVASKK